LDILQQSEEQKEIAYTQASDALNKWWLPIPNVLKKDFLQYQYRQNANFLVGINIFAHTFFFLYTFANYLIVPDIFWLDLPIRAFLLVTLLPLFLLLIRKVHNISFIELLLPLSALIGSLAWFNLLMLSHSEYVQSYLYASVVFIVALNIGIRANFISGVLSSLLISAVTLHYVNILNHSDNMALFLFCLVYGPVLSFGLFISWHNTYTGRRLFLYAFIDEMNKADLQEANRHLLMQSHTDSLTGLPNRALFEDRAKQTIAKAIRDKSKLALMIVDLDRFKPVNDTYGHATGDEVLKEVARRMASSVRESDTVARLGGDEFVVLLPIIDTADDAWVVAVKIREKIERPLKIGENWMGISSSIGVAIFPDQGNTAEELFRNADTSLYRAKELGRNRVEMARDSHQPN